MKRILFIATIFLLVSAKAALAQEIPLDLDEALTIALRDNRDVLYSAQSVEKAKAAIKEARSELFPHVDLGGYWSHSRGYYTEPLTSNSFQLGISQLIFSGGRVINTIRQTEYSKKAQEASLDTTKQQTILTVKKAFYTLLLAEHFADINGKILANTQEHLAYMQARYGSGEASGSDILKIKESLAVVEQAYVDSLNQVQAGQELMRNLLYLENTVIVRPQAGFLYQPQEIEYDQSLLKAYKDRPEIKQYEAQEKAAEAGVSANKAGYLPSVYVAWDYYNSSHTFGPTGMLKGRNDYNVLSVNMAWPVFDGFKTKAKVDQALVDLKQTRIMKEQLVKDIATELKNAYIGLKDAISRIKATEAEMAFYNDNFSVISEQSKKGITSTLDLDDASLRRTIAGFNRDSAIYDYITAQADFARAIGGN